MGLGRVAARQCATAATARRLSECALSGERARESRGRSGDDRRSGAVVVDRIMSG